MSGIDKGLRRRLPLKPGTALWSGARMVRSLEEIPDFDTPEAEERFWKSVYISKSVLDQIPILDDDHEQ